MFMFNHLNKNKGSIAIIMTFVMFFLVLFAGILVDSSKIQIAHSNVQNVLEMASDSGLADYNNMLKEIYGLFAISDESKYEENVRYYLEKSLMIGLSDAKNADDRIDLLKIIGQDKKVSKERYTDLFDFGIKDFKAERVYTLANTDILKGQIVDYMKYRGPKEFAETILDKLGAFKGVGRQAEVLKKKTAVDKELEDIQDSQKDLKEQLVIAQGFQPDNTQKLINFMLNNLTDKIFFEKKLAKLNAEAKKTNTDKKFNATSLENNQVKFEVKLPPDQKVEIIVKQNGVQNVLKSNILTEAKNNNKDSTYSIILDGYKNGDKVEYRFSSSSLNNPTAAVLTPGPDDKTWYNYTVVPDSKKEIKETKAKIELAVKNAKEHFDSVNIHLTRTITACEKAIKLIDEIKEDSVKAKKTINDTQNDIKNDTSNVAMTVKKDLKSADNEIDPKKLDEMRVILDGNLQILSKGTTKPLASHKNFSKFKGMYPEFNKTKYLEIKPESISADDLEGIRKKLITDYLLGPNDIYKPGDKMPPMSVLSLNIVFSYYHEYSKYYDSITDQTTGLSTKTKKGDNAGDPRDTSKDIAKSTATGIIDKQPESKTVKSLSGVKDLLSQSSDTGVNKDIASMIKDDNAYILRQKNGVAIPADADAQTSIKKMDKSKLGTDDMDFSKAKNDNFMTKVYNYVTSIGDVFDSLDPENLRDEALVNQYIVSTFKNIGTKKEDLDLRGIPKMARKHYIDNEIEYILSGDLDAKKAKTSVYEQMLFLRLGFNSIFAYSDKSMALTARAAATVIIGWTGCAFAVALVEKLILLAWATAESAIDVSSLMDGKPVPLMKTKATWNLSVENGAKGLLKDLIAGAASKAAKEGIKGVESYLNDETSKMKTGIKATGRSAADMAVSSVTEVAQTKVDGIIDSVFEPLETAINAAGNAVSAETTGFKKQLTDKFIGWKNKGTTYMGECKTQAVGDVQDDDMKSLLNIAYNAALEQFNGLSLDKYIDPILNAADRAQAVQDTLTNLEKVKKTMSTVIMDKIITAPLDKMKSIVTTKVNEVTDIVGGKVTKGISTLKTKAINGIDEYVDKIGGTSSKIDTKGKQTKTSLKASLLSLSYSEYQWILLMVMSSKDKLKRTQDLIQVNMREEGQTDFKIANCVTDFRIKATVSTKYLFMSLPIMPKTINGRKEMDVILYKGYK